MQLQFYKMKFILGALLAFAASANMEVADVSEMVALPEISDAAEISNFADYSWKDYNMPTTGCNANKYITQCHPAKCSWCTSILPNQEPTGCKDKGHATFLQGTGTYWCEVDKFHGLCNGRKQGFCDQRPECVWCSSETTGGACMTIKQGMMNFQRKKCAKIAHIRDETPTKQ